MGKRKTSRNLMADLLSDGSRESQAKSDATTALPGRVRPSLKPDPKVKMTLSLPSSIADRLTRFETEMRLQTGERGHALAKSAIISTALILLLDEYDDEGMESRLARHMDPRRRGQF
ncbi:MAG: hypothetical protein M9918_20570 [Anaerolineae bacterium]|nr:hypothetical protein [Anaerolineae bacterium]